MPRRFWQRWFAGLFVWLAAMLLAAPWDLSLSRAVVDRASGVGQLVRYLGEAPSWFLIAGALLVLATARQRHSRLRPLLPLARAVALLTLLYPVGVTQSLKLLWGRVRFVNLGPGLSGYTPWYVPAGVGAGRSFPSGHAAMGFLPAPVPLFLAARGRRRAALLAWAALLGYGVTVAWGRVVLGQHYLTDTLFSAGAELLLAALLSRRLYP